MEKFIELVDLLKRKELSISSAESCTGGMFLSNITNVDGASNVLKMGYVTYSNESKISILKVNPKTILNKGVVSFECAEEMAKGLRKISGADICVSVTGYIGLTGGDKFAKLGDVYFAIDYQDYIHIYKYNFSGDRIKIKEKICDLIATQVIELIK